MPSFTVKVHRVVEHDADFTITAKDEDEAEKKIEALVNSEALYKFETDNKIEWELDDTNYEILEVNEE